MKLNAYLPELPKFVQEGQRLSELANFLEVVKSADSGGKYNAPTMGVDQLVSQWLRQQLAYRYQMIIDLQTIALTVGEIRAPIHHITSEVFRRGIRWAPKFAVKCTKKECGQEHIESVDKCERCGGTDLRKVDESQKERFDKFLDDGNVFDQSLENVLRELHFDLNTVDDSYLYLGKEYISSNDISKPVLSKVTEIRRLHPALVEFDLDSQGLPKNAHWFCLIHRDKAPFTTSGNCPDCGRKLVPSMYVFWHRGTKKYLLDSEIVHLSKFSPSETYGWSPIMTIFEKALTLIGMDRNLHRYFYERRMPAQMIMVYTDDPDNLRKERGNIEAKMRIDPNYVPMVAVSAKQGRGRVDVVRLFHTLQEMDYFPVRQEIRERIAEMWGVTPAWQGAPEAFGGLSTQTTQLTVMSRVVEGDQRLFHDKLFPQILEAFGVTDWKLELLQPEEKAEATRLAFAQQRAAAANMLFQMGFDVKVKSPDVGLDEIDFVISGEAKRPDMGGMFGGGGGIPSQMMPPGQEDNQEEGADENPTAEPGIPMQQMLKSEKTWLQQLADFGHIAPLIKGVHPSGNKIWFISGSIDWVANFANGKLLNIEKAIFPKQKKTYRTSERQIAPYRKERQEEQEILENSQ